MMEQMCDEVVAGGTRSGFQITSVLALHFDGSGPCCRQVAIVHAWGQGSIVLLG